jgi:hypothetical protein
MPGPTPPWDQSGDPRDNTVDLPRIDPGGPADFRSRRNGARPVPGSPELIPGDPGPPVTGSSGPALAPLPEPGPNSSSFSVPDFDQRDPSRRPGSADKAEPLPPRRPPPVSRLPSGGYPHDSQPQPAGRPDPGLRPDFGPLPDVPPDPGPPPGRRTGAGLPPASLRAPLPPAEPASAAGLAAAAAGAEPAMTAPARPGLAWPELPQARPVSPEGPPPGELGPEPVRTEVVAPRPASEPASVPVSRAAMPGPRSASPPGRALPGSRADLLGRLSRLPDGHPSALFDDGGTVRPPATRLKQLELGLPAPGRDPADGRPRADYVVAEPAAGPVAPPASAPPATFLPLTAPPADAHARAEDVQAGQVPAEDLAARGGAEPADAGPRAAEPDPYEQARAILAELQSISRPAGEPLPDPGDTALTRGDQNAPEDRTSPPDRESAPPVTSRESGPAHAAGPPHGQDPAVADHDSQRGLPARPDRNGNLVRPGWQDPYASPAANGHSPAATPASSLGDSALGPWRTDRRPNGHGPNGREPNGHEPGSREREAGDPGGHERNGSERNGGSAHYRLGQPDSGYSRPASGPAPEPGSESRQVTGPRDPASAVPAELRDVVRQALTASQAAEGRTVFGGYGSSGLTPAIQRIAAQLPVGGLAAGSEANSLKPAARFAAKLARLAARNPGRDPEELVRLIGDAVRYAFAFDPGDYTEATWLVHRRLKAQGFDLEARRNRWESPEYKGIFSRWRDPAHGQVFEIQFHTTASWAVAQRTHDVYIRITDPGTPPDERARLRARQVTAAAEAKAPPGCMEIADFQAEAR